MENFGCNVRYLIRVLILELRGQIDGDTYFRMKIIWERSSFGSWLSSSEFWDVPVTVPDCSRTCEIRSKSSNFDRAPRILRFVLLNSWDNFLSHFLYFLWHLSNIVLLNSSNESVLWLIIHRVFFLTISSNRCQLLLVSQRCRFEE